MEKEDIPAVSVNDAMRLTKYSRRQIDRYIADGTLKILDRRPHQPRQVTRTSIEALNEARGYRPIDEVDVLKEEHLKQKQVAGEVLVELAEIRTESRDFQGWVKRKIAELEDLFRSQTGQRSRGSAPAGPDGAIMLVDFARAHKTTIGKLRGLAERDPTLATVIERPGAKEKKKKWMIKPEQMAPMLAALEKRGFAYTPCTSCPHTVDVAAALEMVAEEPSLAQ